MSKTVFIVGAGASCEIDFPNGEALVEQIAKMTTVKYDAMHRSEFAVDTPFFDAARPSFAARFPGPHVSRDLFNRMRELSAGVVHAQSIDNFLALHESKEQLIFLGKLAIAYIIGKLERESGLYVSTDPLDALMNRKGMPITKWYGRFFKALTSECKPEQLPSRLQDICIICFNYDRNIEQYLLRAIQSAYLFSESEAAAALENLTIWHPYGSLGQLPICGGNTRISYGPKFNEYDDPNVLKATAEGLRTFSEGSADLSESPANRVKSFLQRSNRIVVLGFGYLPANMNLLRLCSIEIDDVSRFNRKVFGTCYGSSEFDRLLYAAQLADIFGAQTPSVHLSDTTCAQLFQEYSGALRFS